MTESLIKKAQQAFNDSDFKTAVDLFEAALKDNPSSHDIKHALAVSLAQLGNYHRAENILRDMLAHDSEATWLNSLGNILSRQKKYQEAEDIFLNAINLKPDYTSAYSNLGNCYLAQKKYKQAINAYKKAITLNPHYVEAHYNLGTAYAAQQQYAEAQASLQQTIKLAPKHAAAYGQLAQIYLDQNIFDQAKLMLKKRLALNPQHAKSHFDLGIMLLNEQQVSAALEHLETAAQLNDAIPWLNYHLGLAYLQQGQNESALAHFLRETYQAPHLESNYNIAVLLMDMDRHQEAQGYFSKVLASEPNHLATLINLGALYLKTNQRQEAIKIYQRLSQLEPDNREFQHILAALTQTATPNTSPTEYVKNLFDHYAAHYDQHLKEYLKYQVPPKLVAAILEENTHAEGLTVLDLGCGTGWAAELIAPYAKKIIGIDLAPQMLEQAKQKAIYTELIADDIHHALTKYHDEFDVIMAADVFTYIGDLQSIFEKCHTALKTHGLLAFSTEQTHSENFVLQPSVRYAHNKNYILALAEKLNFKVKGVDNLVLRQQFNKPVTGYLFIFEKNGKQT